MIERAIAMLEEQQSKVQARSPQWGWWRSS